MKKRATNIKKEIKIERLSPVAAALVRAVDEAMKQMPEGASKESLRRRLADLTNGKITSRHFVQADFPLIVQGDKIYRRTSGVMFLAECVSKEMALEIALRLNRDNQVYPEEE